MARRGCGEAHRIKERTRANIQRNILLPRYNVGEFDDRTWNTGYHDGVMGLWFMTGERCKTKGCENEDDSGPMDDRVIDQDDFIKIKTA